MREAETGRSSRERGFASGLTVLAMTAVMALDTADQSAIGATAPQVRAAFGIGQTQIGVLATSSTLVGVAFTLPFGILADRARRIRLLRLIVIIWTVAMVGVGAAPGFGLMLVAHSVLGLVTGASGPLIASVVGDLVPQERRGKVYSALLLGELTGSVVGLAAAGELAALVDWRWAYRLLACTGVLVLVLLARAREPARRSARPHSSRRQAHEDGDPVTLRSAFGILLHNRTLVLLVLASSLGYYFFAGVQTFAVSLLGEAYGASAAAAPILVVFIGLALAVGVLIGGPAGDRLLRRRPSSGRLPLLVLAFAGSLAFIVPALASSSLVVAMPLLIAGGILLGMANPPLDATRLDIVASRLRGRAEALRSAVKDGADASAPLLFGALGAGIGLQPTFLVMTSSLLAAFLLCCWTLRTYSRDAPGGVAPRVVDERQARPAG